MTTWRNLSWICIFFHVILKFVAIEQQKIKHKSLSFIFPTLTNSRSLLVQTSLKYSFFSLFYYKAMKTERFSTFNQQGGKIFLIFLNPLFCRTRRILHLHQNQNCTEIDRIKTCKTVAIFTFLLHNFSFKEKYFN